MIEWLQADCINHSADLDPDGRSIQSAVPIAADTVTACTPDTADISDNAAGSAGSIDIYCYGGKVGRMRI